MGNQIIAHSVMEELALYLIMEASQFLMESIDSIVNDECKLSRQISLVKINQAPLLHSGEKSAIIAYLQKRRTP